MYQRFSSFSTRRKEKKIRTYIINKVPIKIEISGEEYCGVDH